MTRPPTAAAALYPHLNSGAPPVVTAPDAKSDIASALYLRPKPPLRNPYLEGMSQTEWRDALLGMVGLRRKR
jgi:hypothetical protein